MKPNLVLSGTMRSRRMGLPLKGQMPTVFGFTKRYQVATMSLVRVKL